MELTQSSLMDGSKLHIRRLLMITATSALIALSAMSPAAASEIESAEFALHIKPDDSVSLDATFLVPTDSAEELKTAVAGSSQRKVTTQPDGDRTRLTVEIDAQSTTEFENAYAEWAGSKPQLVISEHSSNFFTEEHKLVGTLPAPAFAPAETRVRTRVTMSSGLRAMSENAIASGEAGASGVSLTVVSDFPIEFDAEFTKQTTKGIVVNIAAASAVLVLLIFALRKTLKIWDKSSKKK